MIVLEWLMYLYYLYIIQPMIVLNVYYNSFYKIYSQVIKKITQYQIF